MTTPESNGRVFPEITAITGIPGLDRFAAAVRRLQDLAVGIDTDRTGWDTAAEAIEKVCGDLEQHLVAPGHAPAGRAVDLPGLGHPLLPPWTIEDSGADGVTMRGVFTRFHVGGNNAVHGGYIPLLFDWLFGMVATAAGRPLSRTAYLHVDYRAVTPIDAPLRSRGRIERVDGRKAFVTAAITDDEGAVLCEANGLLIALLPHQA